MTVNRAVLKISTRRNIYQILIVPEAIGGSVEGIFTSNNKCLFPICLGIYLREIDTRDHHFILTIDKRCDEVTQFVVDYNFWTVFICVHIKF